MSILTSPRQALLKRTIYHSLRFYQGNDGIDFGSGANIDDLLTGDCTIELFVRLIVDPAAIVYFLTKSDGGGTAGWRLYTTGAEIVTFIAYHATANISIAAPAALKVGEWYHIAVDFEFATLTARLFIGGVYQAQSTAVGAYSVDAARTLFCNAIVGVGTLDNYLGIGPIRLSNTRRYTGASFNPPRRNDWFKNDANAQLLIPMNEGAGVTVADDSGNGYNGTVTFGANTRWENTADVD